MLKRFQRLARRNCASFTGADGCLAEPNGQPRCQWFREDEQARPYLTDGSLRCPYFEKHVLPIDPAAEARYWNRVIDKKSGYCVVCGNPFERRSNRQKYCPPCSAENQTRNRRLARQRYRQKMRKVET